MPPHAAPPSLWRLIGAPLPVRLATAADPATDAVTLTVVAPPAQDAKNDPELTGLVETIVRHRCCPPAVAARYVGHPEVTIRRLVLAVPELPGTGLESRACDPDEQIRRETVARLQR